MSAKKKAKLCQWCKKRPATTRMNVVVDRFDIQRYHLCNTCAKKATEGNRQMAN